MVGFLIVQTFFIMQNCQVVKLEMLVTSLLLKVITFYTVTKLKLNICGKFCDEMPRHYW